MSVSASWITSSLCCLLKGRSFVLLDRCLLLLTLQSPWIDARLLGPGPDAILLFSRLLEGPLAWSFPIGTNPHWNLLALPSRREAHPPLKGLTATFDGRLNHQNQGIAHRFALPALTCL